MSMLVRFQDAHGATRIGVQIGGTIHDVTEKVPGITAWLKGSVGGIQEAIDQLEAHAKAASVQYLASVLDAPPIPNLPRLLAPIETQEVWAAGVTYERSRAARQEEAQDGGDIYARVYEAKRPELFFKSVGHKVVAPYGTVGIRKDATWSVPEPEFALVINPVMEVVGYTIGIDMSSRDIEGENPLYLPQAKVYTAACALGPGIVLQRLRSFPMVSIHLSISRDGRVQFEAETHTNKIRRTVEELIDYLGRSYTFEEGAVLLTGTGIVPPLDFTLQAGDIIRVQIDGAGTLTNTVMVV
jgi:2-dehydro-3-deoxy-D-arabinonate dehydratase